MDLVEVDVVGAEAAQAVVDFGEDRFAREAAPVYIGPHAAVDFRGEHVIIALGELAEQLADDLFAGAVGVDVGRIEEVDAGLEGLLEEGAGRIERQRPGMRAALGDAVAHAAEADAGDFEAAAAEAGVLHGRMPRFGMQGAGRRSGFRLTLLADATVGIEVFTDVLFESGDDFVQDFLRAAKLVFQCDHARLESARFLGRT